MPFPRPLDPPPETRRLPPLGGVQAFAQAAQSVRPFADESLDCLEDVGAVEMRLLDDLVVGITKLG